MGVEAFCRGVKGLELRKSGGRNTTHMGVFPDSHRPPGFQTRCCCGGANSEAERPRTTPYDLSPSQEKGLKGSNRWPKRGGEQEVYILQR